MGRRKRKEGGNVHSIFIILILKLKYQNFKHGFSKPGSRKFLDSG